MTKNTFAMTPPMGWNSYDYYDTCVTEQDIKDNAKYMSENMKAYGWEYVVVDIEWYSYNVGEKREEHQYIPFEKVEMDGFGRLLPCPDRFPSSVDGMGFKPLADYVHSLGLKFGIHIMRGVPRNAVHQHQPVMDTDTTTAEIADPASICFWNPDMYGLRPEKEGSQAYYDSLFELYADWGVDFVKVDDICRMDMPSAKAEIAMLHKSIMKCSREMVLSLSPGAAKLDESWTYERYANMWRITDDFWDNWDLLLDMFTRCERWQNHVKPGCYPDCDMLPIGYVGKGFGAERLTNFTQDEQKTMMSLWSIFGSPMMVGGELTKMDDFSMSLLTNKDLLEMLNYGHKARQLQRDSRTCIWYSENTDNDTKYLAVFNLSECVSNLEIKVAELGLEESLIKGKCYMDIWTKEEGEFLDPLVKTEILPHGVKLLMIEK